MKKRLTMILVLALCVGLMSACGNSSTTPAVTSAPAVGTDGAAANTGAAITYDSMVIAVGTTGAAEDISTKAMEYMSQYLSEKTGGAMTINLFPSSQLGNASAMMEMVQQGALDIMLEGNFMNSYGVSDAKAGSVSFLNKSKEMYKALNESEVKKDWERQFEELNGIHILNDAFYRNSTCYVSNKKVESLEDLKGLKVRVPPSQIVIQCYEALGMAPTPIAYSESLLSLQQGVVDAIWCTEDAAYTMGFYEVAKYLIELNTDQDSMYLYTNAALYNGLGENERAALEEAAAAAAAYYSGLAEEQLRTNVQKMKDAGIEVITLTPETVNEIWGTVLPVARTFEANGEWTSGLLDKVLEATGQN